MIRPMIVLLVLIAAVPAQEAKKEVPRKLTYRLPQFSGSNHDLFNPFLKKWPYFAECGLPHEEWKGLHHTFLKTFGISTVEVDDEDVLVTFTTSMNERHADAIVRTLYAQWRKLLGAKQEGGLAHARQEQDRADRELHAERTNLKKLAQEGAVWDRADGVQETEGRLRELRHRLVDARIEKAVFKARARAMREHVQTRLRWREQALKRRIQELEEELAQERKNDPGGQGTHSELLLTRLVELREELAMPNEELLEDLTALEIDLVGHEELVKQLQIQMEEERRRRVQIATSPDLGSIHNRTLALEEHTRSLRDQIDDRERNLAEFRKLRTKRVDG